MLEILLGVFGFFYAVGALAVVCAMVSIGLILMYSLLVATLTFIFVVAKKMLDKWKGV